MKLDIRHGLAYVTCPQCGKEYQPELLVTEADISREFQRTVLIQVAYPDATAIQREQLVSGICSDKCWDELFEV